MDDASSKRVDVGYSSNVDLSDASSNRRFSGWEEQCFLDVSIGCFVQFSVMDVLEHFEMCNEI